MSPSSEARPFSRHLAELCEELATRQPERPAIISSSRVLTYSQLNDEIALFARQLADLGVKRGSTVGLLCTNLPEWLFVALGAMRLGARVAAFNTFVKAWDLEYMLAHSRTEVLVTLDRFGSHDYLDILSELLPELRARQWHSPSFPDLREIVVLGNDRSLMGARSFPDRSRAADEPVESTCLSAVDDALILYTSGSSARPKAVPIQHYAAIENGFEIGNRMHLCSSDRVWVPVPLFWAYGATNALPATLTHGAALVLQPVFDEAEALDLIEDKKCTVAYTLPNMTHALINHPKFSRARTSSLRTGLTTGTEAELRRTAEVLGVPRICNIYGSTETYGNCCVTPEDWPLERRAVCQGPPLPGTRLRIADPESGGTQPVGAVGEIYVRGYVVRGYLDYTPGASRAFDEDGWFRTGDLGWLDDEGCLHFVARRSEMIKTGGINVSPSEVEEFLELHPAVARAAVVGVPDTTHGEVVVAFVVAKPNARLLSEELLEFCSTRIARYKIPRRVRVLDELPATTTGKLARRALVELDHSSSIDDE